MSRRRVRQTSVLLMIIVIEILTGGILACHPVEFQIGNECCPKCPAGHRVTNSCTEFSSTSCLPCREGTFMDRLNGMKDCISCATCDSASGLTIKRKCTTTSDSVCKPLDGYFCMDFKGERCEAAVKHKICNPGQYISHKGTESTDTECSDCREGTFSNGTTSLCQPHTDCEKLNLQLIKAGTAVVDAECGESGLNAGVVAGSVVGFVFVIITGVGAAVLFKKPKHIFKGKQENAEKHNGEKRSEDASLAVSLHHFEEATSSADTAYNKEERIVIEKPLYPFLKKV